MTDAIILLVDIRTLVSRALLGDQHAMVQIVNRYRDQVFGLCLHILGQREDAEDVAQESLLRMTQNLHSWDSEREFEPWLLAITSNRCRSRLATRLQQQVQSRPLEFVPPDARWQDELDARVLQEEVQLALESLPPKHGEAFRLFHQNQLSYQEIARHMDVPSGTVKTWVHRARRELARRLVAREVVRPTGVEAS